VAVTALSPSGTVRVRGDTWSAVSISGAVPAGSPVHVAGMEGLRLEVWSEEEVPALPAEGPGERAGEL
ncbi:MAG: NfeD family protein, partial [Acidimicrobiales bacterium]